MTDCDALIGTLQTAVREQVHLATIAAVAPVAAMHLDLARLSADQVRITEALCSQDPQACCGEVTGKLLGRSDLNLSCP